MSLTSMLRFGLVKKGDLMKKAILLVCIVALIAPAAVLVGCGGGSSSSTKTPQQVMQEFWDAGQKQDATTSWNLMSTETQKVLKSKSVWDQAIKATKDTNGKITIGKLTTTGDKAVLKVTVTSDGKSSTTDMPFVKENGAWKLDMTKIFGQ
jgi:hypothetical protein